MASSAFKICPTCQKLWAATFKFCPEHGSPLVEETAEAPPPKGKSASRRSSRILDLAPVTASQTNPSTPAATPAPAPERPKATSAPAARAPVRGGSASKASPSSKATVADVPAAPAAPAPPKASRTAPTLLITPAITDEVAQQALARARQANPQKTRPEVAAAPAPASRPAAAPPAEAETKRKRSGFSETEWFLAPINPDEVDAKTGKVKVDPAKYERNPATPDEKRRRFSLKRDDEE